MTITTAQIRGARAILNWSQSELATKTGLSPTSIGAIEKGQSTPRDHTISNIQRALEDGGIEFIGNDGVRLKSFDVEILKGQEGFNEFSNQMAGVIGKDDREILQANVDDRKFTQLLGGQVDFHIDRMESAGRKFMRIIQREGDAYFPAKNYAEYRWIARDLYHAVPFYVYGDKLAIILFEPELQIIKINYPMIAQAYRLQFNLIWNNAILPPQDLIEGFSLNGA